MSVFDTYIPRIPTISAVQWTTDPEIVDNLREWLVANYGPETPGLIEQYDGPGLSEPTPRGWEITEEGRLFVKQTQDHFWVDPGVWLILRENPGSENELEPMTDDIFQFTYESR